MTIRDLLAAESINLNGTPAGKTEALNQCIDLMAKSGKIADVEKMEYKRPYQMSVQQRKCGSRATAPRTIVACICVQRTWRHLCEYLRTAYSNHCRKSRKYSYAYPARYIEIPVDCFICLHDMCGPSCDFV